MEEIQARLLKPGMFVQEQVYIRYNPVVILGIELSKPDNIFDHKQYVDLTVLNSRSEIQVIVRYHVNYTFEKL